MDKRKTNSILPAFEILLDIKGEDGEDLGIGVALFNSKLKYSERISMEYFVESAALEKARLMIRCNDSLFISWAWRILGKIGIPWLSLWFLNSLKKDN